MIEVAATCEVDGVDLDALVATATAACGALGIQRATLGLMVVGPDHMGRVNGEHRDTPQPTDVLSFPVDGPDVLDGWDDDGPPPELGDILICPDAAEDPLATLVVHGVLHLVGYDHETDDGEMLALQDDLVDRLA